MSQAVRFWIRAPHLSAAGAALVSTLALLWLLFGAFHLDRRLAYLTAPEVLSVKDQGLALQDAAFDAKRLLPIYGSSEFLNASPYAGRIFFSHFPTGFKLFVVGKAGQKTLIIAQRLGAIGDKLRGKKVVILLSSTWFLTKTETTPSYLGNFSPLQASTLIFDSPLSPALKAKFAREMLRYPESLKGHDLLRATLERLTNQESPRETAILEQLGRSGDYFQRTVDEWSTAFALSGEILQQPRSFLELPTRGKMKPDWSHLSGDAAKMAEIQARDRSGADDKAEKLDRKLAEKHSESFTARIDSSDEWDHLRILLQTLRELGAKPLFMDIPINAASFSARGVTASQRAYYYTRLRNEVRPFHFPLATFQENESDPDFFGDSLGHPSPKGWLIFDRVIDQFYHDKLPKTLD